jgi:hypothetical protein
VNVIDLEKSVAVSPDINEGRLQARFNARNTRFVDIAFEFLPDVGLDLEFSEVVVLGYCDPALL